ncbi:MAG: SdpI family protein [Bacteroidota bacterium]
MQFLIGPLLLILSILFKIFPPKKINDLYGYRTTRSMKSQEAWEASNRLSSNLMVGVAVVCCAVQLILFFLLSPATAILVTCILMCVLLLALIPITENFLKKNFE